jgi:tetratricopeptide (TPR) repeat protein
MGGRITVIDKKSLVNRTPILDQQEAYYRELVSLRPRPRFKEGLAKVTYLLNRDTMPFLELFQRVSEICLGHPLEWGNLETSLLERCTDQELEDMAALLRLLTNWDRAENRYSLKLAEILYIRVERQRASSDLPAYSFSGEVKNFYKQCIALDPENPVYRETWLSLLQQALRELEGREETYEVLTDKVTLSLELLQYDIDADWRKPTERLLHKQEDFLFQHQESLKEDEYNRRLQVVYSNLARLNPTDTRYKFSLAELKMKQGIGIKTRMQWDAAYRLFQEVLQESPAHYDAVVRMAIIHSYKSEWLEAYQILTSILADYDIFKKKTKILFCIAYSTVLAHINKIEEAEYWLEKGMELDKDGSLGHESVNARMHIDMCRNFTYYEVHQLGKESVSMDTANVNKMLLHYEDNRLQDPQEKVYFDFRDMDIPKIIGPKKTKIMEPGNRLLILDYLLESEGPRSNEQINQACFSGEKAASNIRMTITHIRGEELAYVFLGKKGADPYITDEVLVNKDGKYAWAFKGPTYVIK